MDFETQRILRRDLPVYAALATALLILSTGAILSLGRDILVPVALAALLSFVLAPSVRGLQSAGVPQGLAVVATVVAAFAVLAAVAVLVGSQLAGIGTDLPRYQGTIRDKLGALAQAASPGGALSRALEAVNELGRDLKTLGGGPAAGGVPGEGGPMPVVIRDGGGLVETVAGFVSPLLHPLATTGLVMIFVVFMLAARQDLRNRMVRLVGPDDMQHTTAVIDDAARRLSRLFLMQLAINLSYGLVVATGLWLIGIPSPILWGVLAAILRFIPYVGAVAGAVPPLALAIAVDPGWTMLVWTALLFVVVEPLLGHGLEPLLFGHSTGLSPLAVIFAATVWTFLWGPIGLVLSTPITVCLVVLGRHVEGLAFLDVMLGDSPALSPPQLFYQRMLAGDPAEAGTRAREFLRERALATYYDEVALEALRLAHEDVARGRLSQDRQAELRRSTERLVERLDAAVRDPRPKGGQVGSEAAAAVRAVGPDRGSATEVISPDHLPAAWRRGVPVICFARPDSLDAAIAAILAQVLTKHGVPARVVTAATDAECGEEAGGTRVVCLSYVEPLSTLHLRHAVRVARRRFPGSRIVLGVWRERDLRMGLGLQKAARADAMTPTIGAALSTVLAFLRQDGRDEKETSAPAGAAVLPDPQVVARG